MIANSIFAIKAIFKEKPYTALMITTLVSTVILGFIIRNFERPYYYNWTSDTNGFQDYSYLWNGIWLIAITMMTVGYGDYFPKTHMGRFIAVIASLWGIFLVSMMVTTLTISTSFDIKEKKSFWILHRIATMEKLKIKASELITLMFRINLVHSRYKTHKISSKDYIYTRCELKNKLMMKILNYQAIKSSLSEFEVQPEELLAQLINKIDKDYHDIKCILKEMVELERQIDKIDSMQDELMHDIDEAIAFTTLNIQNLSKITTFLKKN